MPGGAARAALRVTARGVLDGLARMAGVAHRGLMSPRPDLDQLPERMVVVTLERPQVAAMGGAVDRDLQMIVVVRRKGADALDQLDLDQDAIEPAIIAAVETGSTTCALTEARIEIDGEGTTPLAQMTLIFAVQIFD